MAIETPEQLREALELLMYRVETTRAAQSAYFKNQTRQNVKEAKALEAVLDKAIKYLKGQGLSTERFKTTANQTPLFKPHG
jgi:hypothetical protein